MGSVKPYIRIVNNGIILPCKHVKDGPTWGAGGAIDENGNLVPESIVETAFGQKYEYNNNDVRNYDEAVIYIPIIPNQWGHFLINSICRLWPMELIASNKRVAFCGWGWNNNEIGNNYKELLRYAGIVEERLLYINEVSRFREIIIPTETFGCAAESKKEYIEIIKRIKNNALKGLRDNKIREEKIYLSRCSFRQALHSEVGEKDIERLFEDNGWVVKYPEKLSVAEQIALINDAKFIASVSGSIAHNSMFMNPDSEWLIINKTCQLNHTQRNINRLFGINPMVIDSYSSYVKKRKMEYGMGPYELIITPELIDYIKKRNGGKIRIKSDITGLYAIIKRKVVLVYLICARRIVKLKVLVR